MELLSEIFSSSTPQLYALAASEFEQNHSGNNRPIPAEPHLNESTTPLLKEEGSPAFVTAYELLASTPHPFLKDFIPLLQDSKEHAPDIAQALALNLKCYNLKLFDALTTKFLIDLLSQQPLKMRHSIIMALGELIEVSLIAPKNKQVFFLTQENTLLLCRCGPQAYEIARRWRLIATKYPTQAHQKNFEGLLTNPTLWPHLYFLIDHTHSLALIEEKGIFFIMENHQVIRKYNNILSSFFVSMCLRKHHANRAIVEKMLWGLYERFGYEMYEEVVQALHQTKSAHIKTLEKAFNTLKNNISPQSFCLLCVAGADAERLSAQLLNIERREFITLQKFYLDEIESNVAVKQLPEKERDVVLDLASNLIAKAPQKAWPIISEKMIAILNDRTLSLCSRLEKINHQAQSYLAQLETPEILNPLRNPSPICFSQDASPQTVSRKKESYQNMLILK